MDFTNSTVLLMLILCVFGGFAAGYFGSMAFSASLRRDVTDHDYRLADLEGRVNREVKIRAQQASTKAKDLDREIIALANSAEVSKDNGFSLQDWRKKAFLRS